MPAIRTAAAQPLPQGGAHVVLVAAGSLSVLDPGGSAVGFHVLAPLREAHLVELTRGEGSSPVAAARAERFFAALGKHVEWVEDAPGLVLGRIVCQVINECAFALGEGVGGAHDIDTGMVLGLNHPRGPLRWADTIGLDHVLMVLESLCEEYREERYRPAPVLQRLVARRAPGAFDGGAASSSTTPRAERDLTIRGRRAFNPSEHRTATLSALSGLPSRPRLALPGVVGRSRGGRGLLSGDVHRGASRVPATSPRFQPARVGADDRSSQGTRRASRARPAGGPGRRCRRDRRAGGRASRRHAMSRLWEAVGQLPARQRSAVVLRYVADLPHRDIAVAIGCSEEAARRSLHEGLTKLRKVVPA